MPTSNNLPKNKNSSDWKKLLVWIAIALLLRWQVLEPRWIPSGSMLPTLQIEDRILVEKIRPKLQENSSYHLNVESIVIFKPPIELINKGYDKDSALIKRIVGLPGDLIAVHQGRLFRNGSEIEESWLTKPIEYEMNPIIVPKESIWVLGDNRNNSLDSHLWGSLPEKNIIGTAIWRYWPLNRFGPIRFPPPKRIGTKELAEVRSVM